jgi:TRAP transporter TAXI family solute receptor
MNFDKRFLLISVIFLSFGQVNGQVTILSGPEKGSYSRFVSDMATVLGEKGGIKIINKLTAGSAYNFKVLTNPSSNDKIALIQSDYLNLMIAEDKLNNTNKAGSLKVVMQLATEEIHIITKKSSGLAKLQDLEKKKLGIGNEDQGSFATAKLIKDRSKINWYTYRVGFEEMLKKLAAGTIDAGLIVGSSPLNMLDIDPQVMVGGISLLELDDFNGWAKYYENDTIYRGEYKWLEKNVPTFGVRTLLIVNESKLTDNDKQAIASIKSGIVLNLDLLKKQGHPKWKTVIMPGDLPVELEENTGMAKNPEPAATHEKDVVSYRVQIYSRKYQLKDDQIEINGKSYKTYVYSYLGAYRYTVGEFTTAADAMELQKICRQSGYPEAFVAAFKNNKRSTDPALFK